MKYQIIWSNFAEKQLDEIFEYYLKNVNKKLANKIIKEIIVSVTVLENAPLLGQQEELLSHRNIQYRYLIIGSYKVIYSIEEESCLVKISDVFDTRQNPVIINRS